MGEAGVSEEKGEGSRGGSSVELRPLITLIITLVVVAATAYIALSLYWRQTQPALKNPALLVIAARAYSRDQQARGRPIPQSVSLQDLINLGYLDAKDVQAFQGMEVTLMPAAVTDDPRSILARVKMPDGTEIAVLADGSVRQNGK